jgi:hypothetical protein
MPEQRIHFEGMDQDSDLRLMQPGSYRYALNIRAGSPLEGDRGVVRNLKGNELIAFTLPIGTNKVIGTVENEADETVLYFLYNSNNNHSILRYTSATNTVVTVFEWSGLNFQADYLITGIALVDGILYWTDDYNPPRKLTVAQALAGDYESLKTTEQNFLNLLVPPPNYPLLIVREHDAATTQNFIRDISLQFSYRYQYADGEFSVLGPVSKLSTLARANIEAERNANRVKLTTPADEAISKRVEKIELLAREGNAGKWRIFTTLRRDGAGNFATTNYFYNNTIGPVLDGATAVKGFESVPLKAKTLASTDKRLFLGNYIEGYDKPKAALSLTAVQAPVSGAASGASRETTGYRLNRDTSWEMQYYDNATGTYLDYYGYNSQSELVLYSMAHILPMPGTTVERMWVEHTDTLYYLAWYDTENAIWVYDLSGTGLTQAGVLATFTFPQTYDAAGNAIANNFQDTKSLTGEGTIGVRTVQDGPVTSGSEASMIFKSDSAYQVGVLFKDYGLRNAGVATGAQTVFMPALPETITDAVTHIQWNLTGTGAEIPEWATHYHLVRTRNQAVSFFLQGISADVAYAKEDETAATGLLYSYTYKADYEYLLIDIATLPDAEIGYVYQPGDYLRLYQNGTRHEFEIKGQQGKFLMLPLKDIGTLPKPGRVRFEVYTPYKPSEYEVFYEIGEAYKVLNPGTALRDYSAKSGYLSGDCYLLYRSYSVYGAVDYDIAATNNTLTDNGNAAYVEATCPNDKFWQTWDSDLGKPTVKLENAKQVRNKTGIRFSNPFIPDSRINGLSEFEALNNYTLPLEAGALAHLQPVGTSLLALQNSDSTSIYVGQSEISDTQGQTLVSVSNKVLGSNRPLAGSYGCQHPETVKEHKGSVYWLDMRNGTVCRYTQSGVYPISTSGMGSVFQKKAKSYRTTPVALTAGFDGLHNEYILTIGADTIAFRSDSEAGRWTTHYSFTPEAYGYTGGRLISFKNGSLYLHESDTAPYNNFYGAQYTSELHLVCNQDNGRVKLFQRLKLEGSDGWVAPVITTPDNHESELLAADFVTEEGLHYAEFLRDKLTPNITNPLFEGDELRSYAVVLKLQQAATTPVTLLAANVGFAYS